MSPWLTEEALRFVGRDLPFTVGGWTARQKIPTAFIAKCVFAAWNPKPEVHVAKAAPRESE
jgi:hypothetical protein